MKKVRVFCYGDSNTYGYDPSTGGRYPSDIRWTGFLQRMLGDGYEVLEQGCNGRTTVFPEPGAEWKSGLYALKVCLNTCKPVDLMILMLGTNDIKTYYHASAEQIASGAGTLVETAQAFLTEKCGRAPAVVLVSPIALGRQVESGPFGWEFDREAVEKSRRLAPLYRETARRCGCLFLDAAEIASASETDSVHLGPEGHRKIAEALCEIVRKAAEGDAAPERRPEIRDTDPAARSAVSSVPSLSPEARTRLLSWAQGIVHAAAAYSSARDVMAREMRTGADPDRQEAIRQSLKAIRRRFEETVSETEKAFRLCVSDPGLRGSFYDLMTEIRTTPDNAETSLADFRRRSGI